MENRLKYLRENKGLNLRELARLTETDHVAISKIERGQQSLAEHYAHIFSDFFNVSLDYLMCRTDNKESFKCIEVQETPLTYKNVLSALKNFSIEELLRISGAIDLLVKDSQD